MNWLNEEEACKLTENSSYKPKYLGDPLACFEGKWYFYNETWSDLCGPYLSEIECIQACIEYSKTI
jgi:hypothetical protein